jgi:hypothetical protein
VNDFLCKAAPMTTQTGLERLGRLVTAERGRKFRTVQNARIAAGVNTATWKRVEDGQSVKPFTLAAIEDALGCPVGRAQRIIDGLEAEGAPQTFREYLMAVPLPESFRADVLRLLDAYESEQGVRAG